MENRRNSSLMPPALFFDCIRNFVLSCTSCDIGTPTLPNATHACNLLDSFIPIWTVQPHSAIDIHRSTKCQHCHNRQIRIFFNCRQKPFSNSWYRQMACTCERKYSIWERSTIRHTICDAAFIDRATFFPHLRSSPNRWDDGNVFYDFGPIFRQEKPFSFYRQSVSIDKTDK